MWPFSRKPKILWHLPEGQLELLPKQATPGAMAYDLFCPNFYTVPAHSSVLINLFVAVTIPKGYAIVFGSRSGMAANEQITVEAGWIDNDYRGLLKVLLYNHGDKPYSIIPQQRIAQAMIVKVHNLTNKVSFKYPDPNTTKRGSNGFGSTGR